MDPNTALENLRSAIRRWDNAPNTDALLIAGEDMRQASEALDEWLSKRGFLPEAWER
jgi:hypothetical protein